MTWFVLQSIACSNVKSPIAPGDKQLISDSQKSDRTVLAVYNVSIDPVAQTVQVSPATRQANNHLPLSNYYPNVLKITSFGWVPSFWANIKLTHPFPGSGIDVYDPRIIAIIPARSSVSSFYPEFDVRMNDKAIVAPDGYTKLFDEVNPTLIGNTNPFKAYFKNEEYRTWKSIGNTSETQKWNINLDGFGGTAVFTLVVDVCTNWPTPSRPIYDNAPEPVNIDATIGYGLDMGGGRASVDVTVLDWRGLDIIGGVQIESPDLLNGLIDLSYSNPGPYPYEFVFSGLITNELQASPGDHNTLIASWDINSNTYIFQEFTATVTGDIVFSPEVVNTVDIEESVKGLQIQNGYAFIEDPEKWLSIVDVDPPANAQLVNQVPLSTKATVVRVLGNCVYVMGILNNTLVLSIVNIDSVDSAYLVSEIALPALGGDYIAEIGGFDLTDNCVYVAYEYDNVTTWGTDLYKIDVTLPENPQIQKWISSTAKGADIFVSKNYLYITPHFYRPTQPPVTYTELKAFDISRPLSPTYLGGMKFNNYLGLDLFVKEGYAYLNSHETSFKIVDVDPPSQMSLVTTVDTVKNVQDIFVAGAYAYVIFYTGGMEIFDIDPPESASLINSQTGSGDSYTIVVKSRYAYITLGSPGFQIVKLW